jgi:hypothetical protein
MSSGRATALNGSMTSLQATRQTARAQSTENEPPVGQETKVSSGKLRLRRQVDCRLFFQSFSTT